jgi:hypothetical protein
VATATVTGIYSRMTGSTSGFASGGERSVSLLAGLCSDELINYNNNTSYNEIFSNTLNPVNGLQNSYCWTEPYQYIYTANSVLKNLPDAAGVTATVKAQLIAEAKFIRAFCYFYLVNLYGPVPFYTSTDYSHNRTTSRMPVNEVYRLIMQDLNDAFAGLPGNFTPYNNNRIRPVKWAAAALLARVYLYIGDWTNAEAQASMLIDNPLFKLTSIDKVFLANSTEAIWQLARDNGNTPDAGVYTMSTLAVRPYFAALRESMVKSFDPSDLRLAGWIETRTTTEGVFRNPAKYKVIATSPITEYSMVFRLAEQYLIRAEARAHQPGKLTGPNSAASDLDSVRYRAGLAATTAGTQQEILAAIEAERIYELFSEWGHRWFDLKRTGKADAVLSSLKAPNWQPEDTLFPIPLDEVRRNTSIVQNKGY